MWAGLIDPLLMNEILHKWWNVIPRWSYEKCLFSLKYPLSLAHSLYEKQATMGRAPLWWSRGDMDLRQSQRKTEVFNPMIRKDRNPTNKYEWAGKQTLPQPSPQIRLHSQQTVWSQQHERYSGRNTQLVCTHIPISHRNHEIKKVWIFLSHYILR